LRSGYGQKAARLSLSRTAALPGAPSPGRSAVRQAFQRIIWEQIQLLEKRRLSRCINGIAKVAQPNTN
jgi:hypothetical protein